MIGHMADEEVFLSALGILAGAATLITIASSLYRNRGRKLQVLQDALQSANVDPDTKRLLVGELTKSPLARLYAGGKLLVVIGWLGVFIGVSVLASGQHDAEEVGIPFALMSFGVLTIPFALRELDHKRQTASRRP